MENRQIKIRPADRISSVSEYYFSRKLREIARLNREGKDIISLAIGSPDLPPSKETIDELCATALLEDSHGYQPTGGIPELKEAMAFSYKRFYNVDLDPVSEILPLIGSKEGILHVTLAFVNEGEKVLVPDPGYPTYTSLSKILGARIEKFNLLEKNGWQPDFNELEDKDLSEVKLMWVNYPNMPTGGKAEIKTFERLVKFAVDHNLVVVNDNPYSLILNSNPLSLLQIDGAKDCCIEFNSMSKSHNMPGWRVGMCASNQEFINWILKIKSHIDSGTFRGIQLAASKAFLNSDDWHLHFNIEVYKERRKIAEKIMERLGCQFNFDQVGMFLWGKVPEGIEDAEILTEKVLNEAGVFITPGFIFGDNGKRYIRISLCAKKEKLNEALKRIEGLYR